MILTILIIPFLWPIVAAAAIWIVSLSLILRKYIGNIDGKKIVVLGPQQAGKTYFLYQLQGKEYKRYESKVADEHLDFTFTTKSGKKVKIKRATDISGASDRRSKYSPLISENDIIFYFFDIKVYFSDEMYRRESNSRLSYIYDDIRKKNKEVTDKAKQTKLVCFGTHADECDGMSPHDIRQKYDRHITEKPYRDTLEHTIFINLTDKQQVEKFVDKVFN